MEMGEGRVIERGEGWEARMEGRREMGERID